VLSPTQASKQVAAGLAPRYQTRQRIGISPGWRNGVGHRFKFQLWRSPTSDGERIIGYKRGTPGGASRGAYLNKALEIKFSRNWDHLELPVTTSRDQYHRPITNVNGFRDLLATPPRRSSAA